MLTLPIVFYKSIEINFTDVIFNYPFVYCVTRIYIHVFNICILVIFCSIYIRSIQSAVKNIDMQDIISIKVLLPYTGNNFTSSELHPTFNKFNI